MDTTQKATSVSSWLLPAAVVIILLQFSHVFGYMTPSMLMSDIMTDLGVDYSLAGLTMTIITAVGGVFMFVGSMIQDKFGTRNILVAAAAIICIGNGIGAFAPNIWVLLGGRFLGGVGFGLMTTGSYTYISAWFKGKARGMMNSVFLVASSMGTLLSTVLAIPLRDLTGSWRMVLGVYAVVAAVTTVVWLLFGRSNGELDENRRRNQMAHTGSFFSSFGKALAIRQIRVMIVLYVLIQVAASASLTYTPTYLTEGLGVSAAVMTGAVSLRPVFGMMGNLSSGVLMSAVGRRKPIIFVGLVMNVVASLLMVNAGASVVLLYLAMAMMGVFSNLPVPAINTTVMEAPAAPTPSIVGACSALVNGIGSLSTLIVPSLFTGLTSALGMKNALMIMFSVLAISAVLSLFLTETGPKARRTGQN